MDSSSLGESVPRVVLLLENPRKSNNLGPILRCAAAFGVAQVVAVGYDKCSTGGSHGAAKHVPIIAFPTLDQAVQHVRLAVSGGGCGCSSVVGLLGGYPDSYSAIGYHIIERDGYVHVDKELRKEEEEEEKVKETTHGKTSVPVHARKFQTGNFCLVLNKNHRGLASNLARVCESFVHVPHAMVLSGENLEHSTPAVLVDTQAALSITLHHYCSWAKYDERTSQGYKFQVVKVQKGRLNAVFGTKGHEQPTASRKRNRQEEEHEDEDEEDMTGTISLFNDGKDGDY